MIKNNLINLKKAKKGEKNIYKAEGRNRKQVVRL